MLSVFSKDEIRKENLRRHKQVSDIVIHMSRLELCWVGPIARLRDIRRAERRQTEPRITTNWLQTVQSYLSEEC